MATDLDPKLTERIVHILKSQGLFDQWRKDCLSFVDSRPAYEHLRDKVNTSVATFLTQQKWSPGLNKNQLRERLRNHIQQETFFESGVTKIIDQIVTPKVYPTIKPQVEEIVYTVLGLKKSPLREEKTKPPAKFAVQNSSETSVEGGNTSNTEISKTPMKESSGDSPVSTVSGQISQGTANDVQDFSESAHLPERQQSPPTMEPFDNFSNLKKKLEQSDPLKPVEPLPQDTKAESQSVALASSSEVSNASSQKSKTGSHENSNIKTSSSETSTLEKREDRKESKSDDSSKKKRTSSSHKESSSRSSKSSKSSKERSDSHRSKDRKESRSGRSDESRGSSRKGDDKRESSRSHRRKSRSRSRHRHHSHEKSHSGRSNCRDETTKHRKRSRDRDDGGNSGGPSGTGGGAAGGNDGNTSKKESKSSNGHKGCGANAVNNSPVESENAQVPSDKLSTQAAVTCMEGSHSNLALSSGGNLEPSIRGKSPKKSATSELDLGYRMDEGPLETSNLVEDIQYTSVQETGCISASENLKVQSNGEIASEESSDKTPKCVLGVDKSSDLESVNASPKSKETSDLPVHTDQVGSQKEVEFTANMDNTLSQEEILLFESLSKCKKNLTELNKELKSSDLFGITSSDEEVSYEEVKSNDFLGFTNSEVKVSQEKSAYHLCMQDLVLQEGLQIGVSGDRKKIKINSTIDRSSNCSRLTTDSKDSSVMIHCEPDFQIPCCSKDLLRGSKSRRSSNDGGRGSSQSRNSPYPPDGKKSHPKTQKASNRSHPLNQRYSSTDLYKPRPKIASSSGRRRQTQGQSDETDSSETSTTTTKTDKLSR